MAAELDPKDYNFRVPPAFLKAEGNYDIRPKLKNIAAPVLLLQGRQDLAGEANICEAHSLINNSTWCSSTNVGTCRGSNSRSKHGNLSTIF